MHYFKRITALLAVTALAIGLIGCSPKEDKNETGQMEKLTLGLMPAVDAAPIFLAQEKGYFKDLGLEVATQVFTNAQDRQSALQSGEIDGAITDVIALVNNVDNGFPLKITTSTDGMFPFLTNTDFEGKKDLKAGMMEVSVTNYITDRALAGKYNIEKVYINDIPGRLEMVGKKALDLAVIPEPMASQGQLNGLKKVIVPTGDSFSPDALVFTQKALDQKEEALSKFHKAYNQAVEEINKDDKEAREILIEKLGLNPETKDLIEMTVYNLALVPDEAYIQAVIAWNKEVLGKEIEVNTRIL